MEEGKVHPERKISYSASYDPETFHQTAVNDLTKDYM